MNARQIALGLALIAMFFIFASSRVQAQTVLSFDGLEIGAGESETDETYGWFCSGQTTGALPGNFVMTSNYSVQSKGAGGQNLLTGGNWSLPVYSRTIAGLSYMGELYGSVKSGQIEWDQQGYIGTMEAELVIAGGTQLLYGSRGTVELKFTINRSPSTIAIGPPTMNGTLSVYFR